MYSSINNRNTEQIYDLIDDIERRLMKVRPSNKYMNRTTISNVNPFPPSDNSFILRNQQQNMTLNNIRYMNSNLNNPSQSQIFAPNNLNNNTINEFEIRNII